MRFFTIILLAFFVHHNAVGSAHTLQPVTEAPENSAQKRIDLLNNRAQQMFLQSPDRARKMAEQALFLSENAKYATGMGQSFLNIANIYWSQSYYPVSLYYLKSALNYLPKTELLLLSDCYNSLGRTYAELKDYEKALYNLDRALRLAGTDKSRVADVYSERAYVYDAMQKYDDAIDAVNVSLMLNRQAKNEGNIAVLYGRLGSIYRDKKEYGAALKYDDTAHRMSLVMHNNRLRAKTLIDYAIINNALQEPDVAIAYAGKGIALADSIGVVDATTSGYRSLIKSYELKKELKQALVYQKKYNDIQDSLNTIDKVKSTQLIQNYFTLSAKINEVAQMEQNDVTNKAKIRSQEALILILTLSLVVVIAIAFVTYRFYQQKKQLNNKLHEQHEALIEQKQVIEVQTANLQMVSNLKDRLLAVIGHDLRTPLANLSNITGMFDTEDLSVDDVHDLMRTINPMIKGAELTLSNLVEWAGNHIKGRNVEASNIDLFLLGLEMEQTFTHALQQKNIEFVNKAYAGRSVLADENHVKVVLRNLLSNAIKFTDTKGCITFATRSDDNALVISITDNGKGMTGHEMEKLFSITTHFSNNGTSGESGTGIGLLLCKELVELNGGRLWVSSTVGKGSTFYFSLPLVPACV